MVVGGLFFGTLCAIAVLMTVDDGNPAGIAASAVGLLGSLVLFLFTSSGVHADAQRRGIVRWRGPGFPLRTSFEPVDEDHQLELISKTVTHRGGSRQARVTITTHTLAFVRDGERVVVAQHDDRNEVRRIAELVAKAFAVDLHEDHEGERRTIALADLDEPLRARLLRGKVPKRPKKSKKHQLDYQRDGAVGIIDLATPPMSWKPVLVYTGAVGAMLLFWFNRGSESDLPFYIGLMGFVVVFSAVLTRLVHHRTRARRETAHIVASPDGLELTLRGMVQTRQVSFAAAELEDLDVVQVGNADVYALLARSDEQEVQFAAGTPRAALKWTRKAIAYHLTR
jgi:hypothetical protein